MKDERNIVNSTVPSYLHFLTLSCLLLLLLLLYYKFYSKTIIPIQVCGRNNDGPPYKRTSCGDWLVEQVWCSKVEQGSRYDSWNTVQDPYKCHCVILGGTASPRKQACELLKICFSFFSVQLQKFVMHLYYFTEGTNSKITMFTHFQEYHRNLKLFRVWHLHLYINKKQFSVTKNSMSIFLGKCQWLDDGVRQKLYTHNFYVNCNVSLDVKTEVHDCLSIMQHKSPQYRKL